MSPCLLRNSCDTIVAQRLRCSSGRNRGTSSASASRRSPASPHLYNRPMGPLAGLRVIEFEAIGPGPFCGMMLADMGADVLVIDRTIDPGLGVPRERWNDVMMRGRRSLTLDLKSSAGI